MRILSDVLLHFYRELATRGFLSFDLRFVGRESSMFLDATPRSGLLRLRCSLPG